MGTAPLCETIHQAVIYNMDLLHEVSTITTGILVMTIHLQTHTSTQHRMACNVDSWRQPLTAIQIAELQPEWDEVDKSNGLLPPDAPPTQALPDRTQCSVSKRTPTGGNTSSAVCYRSITAQRQAATTHAHQQRAIKNRDKLCAKRQLKLDIYIKRVPMKYKAATDSEDSKRCTIKNKDKLCSTKQLKLDKYFKKVHTEYKAVTDSEDSECDCPIRTYFICHHSGRIPLHTPPEEHTPHCKSAYC